MKICEYIPTASFFVGGGEIYPLLQTKALSDRGAEVTLVTLKTDFESEYFSSYKINNPKINFISIESPIESKNSFSKRPLTHDATHELYYSLSRNFIDLCEREKYDVVITHYGPAALTVPKSTKEILFLHGVPSTYQPANFAAVNVADKLLSVSKSIVTGWHELYSTEENIEVLYNAVDPTVFYKDTSIEKDIDILFLGRLIEIKGVQHLVKAIGILKNEYGINLKLTIAGKGPYQEELEKTVADLKLQTHVSFIGFVEESDKNNLYNRSKICVFPSYAKEGVLTTMLEAASCGSSIITANCCGMIDFIKDGENGLLFEPENEADLAKKIMKLVNDEQLSNEIGENARKDIEEKWNWNYHAERFEEIIKELIS